MFRNIIWDVDGTLFDTYPAIAQAIKAALHELGKDASLNNILRQLLCDLAALVSNHAQGDVGAEG